MEDLVLQRQPYSAEAEQAVLGSLLIRPEAVGEAGELVSTEDFYIPENRIIFETLISMFTMGENIDPIVVLEVLKQREIYDDAGGRAYLYKLMDMTPTAANMPAYAKIVREKARLRRFAETTGEAHARALAVAGEAHELIEALEQQLYEMRGKKGRQELVHISEIVGGSLRKINENKQNEGKLPGLSTGFSDLDYYTTGLNRSDFILMAARPSVGKTAVVMNMALTAAREGATVAVFNLEMSRDQLVHRLLASESMVDLKKIKTAELSNDEWFAVASASRKLANMDMYIDDTATITVQTIRERCRRVQNLGLVVIDYLQLISGTRKDGNRVQEVGEISRALKILAKDLNVPVLCCSQLSRASDKMKERPRLSDLRDSGAIEQDADIVMFLYREEDHNPEVAEKNVCECIIAKNRNGQTGTVKLRWMGSYMRFVNKDTMHGGA